MTTRTYRGSCHCGVVAFEADIDLAAGTGRCNCSYCVKVRSWNVGLKPEAFRLTAGEGATTSYRFGTMAAEHVFCATCGVHAFTRGEIEEIGGAFVAVAVNCLDDATPQELLSGPVHYADGRHNNWRETPDETRHL